MHPTPISPRITFDPAAVVRPFDRQRILLGVTGGIASYKAAWLARLLTQHGAEVDVVLSRAATEFVGAITFEALTGRPVHTALIASGHALDHIRLARAASLVIVAPATADFLARAAGGHSDDLLSAILLATRAPVLLVPAMNDHMWSHAQVQRNCETARILGYHVLTPDDGPLAVGEGSGPGRMPEPETIVEHAARLLEPKTTLANRRVLVTAGPTREAIDPVRFISNRSSGRMGVEIAAAAARRHAQVTMVSGPLEVRPPASVDIVDVESTREMRDAVARELPVADVLIMAAAPADFAPANAAADKIKKDKGPSSIELTRTDDILVSTRDARKDGAVIVGFALETGSAVAEASRKLQDKGLDLVVANDATEAGAGFGTETNRVTLVHRNGDIEHLPLMSKRDVADAILDRVERLLDGR
jgi:phosphopantothenoylcysteine decarboxylase/phosphopantothenate--cysteine ligase